MLTDKLRKMLLCSALCVAASTASAGYYEGFEAYTRGDFETAMKEWKKVAEPGFSLFGSGIPDDPKERQEMADARYAIGLLYWNGKGVQQDYQKAAKWMKDAAEIGHGEAQLKLGYMHINGQGVPQDPGKAEGWLSQSAQQGNMDAQYNLAVLYYKGLAGEPDVEKARYWFAKAAEQGDKVSKRVLKDLAQPGQSLAIDQAANQGGSTVAAVASQTPKVASREEPVSTTIQKGRFTEGSLNPPRWLAKQSDGNYTIQVLASSSEAGINKVVNQHRGFGPFGYYTKNKQGQRLYVLVQGVYSDAESAKRAVAALPADLQKNKPYPVRIGKLRQHLN